MYNPPVSCCLFRGEEHKVEAASHLLITPSHSATDPFVLLHTEHLQMKPSAGRLTYIKESLCVCVCVQHCSENGGISPLDGGLPDFYTKRVLPDRYIIFIISIIILIPWFDYQSLLYETI